MLWLEIAWGEIGVKEIKGAEHNTDILQYFIDAGREDITEDETSWCMAFYLALLARSGVPITLPKEERLLARSALKIGQPIDEPRAGCCAVLRRGNSEWKGHVGIVTGWTPTHLKVLGGNQANSVSEQWFDRAALLGLRWPALPATVGELADAGSRTVKKSGEVKRDGFFAMLLGGDGKCRRDARANCSGKERDRCQP